jgi:hypothetical protein
VACIEYTANFDDQIWHMHFENISSIARCSTRIVLYSLVCKFHHLYYRLNFPCTNNITEFESLILGLEKSFELGCIHFNILETLK